MVKWLKNISVMMMVALCSVLIMVGCGDLYSRLSLSVTHSGGTNYIELVIVDGAAVEYEVTATVSGMKKGVSDRVRYTIENGNNIIVTEDYRGDGETVLTIRATAHGQCDLTISTVEGNKSTTLNFMVYKKVESVEFTSDKLAIPKNGTLDLNNYIKYGPDGTNQLGATFSLVPVMLDDETSFAYSENYASITDGVLRVDPEATLPIDEESGLPYVTVVGTSVFDGSISTEVMNIYVVDVMTENQVSLVSNSNNGLVTLVKNVDNEYHVVLASNVGFTNTEGANSLLFKRRLVFMLGDDGDDYDVEIDEKYLESYQSNPNRTESEKAEFTNFPVMVTKLDRSGTNVEFDVKQKKVNEFVISFHIRHMVYDGLPEIVVKVRFEVIPFPTDIYAVNNGQEVTAANPLKVMNRYSGNLNGSALRIYTNNDSVASRLYFSYAIDPGTAATSSVVVTTSNYDIKYEPDTNILSGSTLYLFHEYTDKVVEAIEDASIIITYTYDLNPASISGAGAVATTGNFSYTIQKKIPITFRMGIDSIPFISDILTDSGKYEVKIDASKPSDTLILDTSALGGVFADEFTYEYSTELFTLKVDDTQVFVVPNTLGLSGTYTLVVKDSMRNLYSTCEVIVYVPFANTNENSILIDIENINNHKENLLEMVTEEKNAVLSTNSAEPVLISQPYNTIRGLTLKTGTVLPLQAFNYIMDPAKDSSGVTSEDDMDMVRKTYVKKVNINHYIVSVDIPFRYGEYKDGVLTIKNNSYTNTEEPLQIVFTFRGYNNEGAVVEVKHTIDLLIYKLVSDLSVSISNPNIYEYNSVGALNADKTTSTVRVTNTLNNASVLTFYVLDYVVAEFKASNGETVQFKVTDLITFTFTEGDTFINVTAKPTGSIDEVGSGIYKLNSLLSNYGNINNVLAEIYSKNFKIDMVITLDQFGRTVVSSASIGTLYAIRAERIILNNVNNAGLYFDIREMSEGDKRDINFTIEPSNASNKNIRLIYDENNVFNCMMLDANTIRIYPNSAGVANLRIAFEDSYEEVYVDGETITYVPTRYVDIRIKVADGSRLYPFEISDVEDISKMMRDINNGEVDYFYVLTKDINLSSYDHQAPANVFNGGLNGLFEYELDGTKYSIQNSIIGLNMNVTGGTAEVGFFSVIEENAIIENMNFVDARVKLTTDYSEDNPSLSIGILAGMNFGTINNTRVTGSIEVDAFAFIVEVGGMVGTNLGIIQGLPSINSGLGDSDINSIVDIKVNRIINIDYLDGTTSSLVGLMNVGGLVGMEYGVFKYFPEEDLADIIDVNVVASIQVNVLDATEIDGETPTFTFANNVEFNEVSVGGIAGYALGAKISNVMARVYNITGTNNIGGIVGILEISDIVDSKVQFVNRGISGLQSANIVGYNNLGGIAGKTIDDTIIKYSYVRSFYNKSVVEINNADYFGNIVSIADGNSTLYDEMNTINVGGIVGLAEDVDDMAYLSIQNSYANVDINTTVNPVSNNTDGKGKAKYKVGGMVGLATTYTRIANSYVLNNILMPSAIKQTKTVTITVEKTEEESGSNVGVGDGGVVEEEEGPTDEEVEIEVPSFGYFVGNELDDTFVVGKELSVVETSYSVVNHNNNTDTGFYAYVTDTNTLNTSEEVLNEDLTDPESGNTYNYKYLMDKYELIENLNETNGFNITTDHEYNKNPLNVTKKTWYLNDKLNEGLPVLFDQDGGILFTVVPTSITGIISDNPMTFTNNSHIKLSDSKVILFYNQLTRGVEYVTNNIYKIVLEGNVPNLGVNYNNVITVRLGVDPALQGIVEVEGAMTITSSDLNVAVIENGNSIRTVGEGVTKLTISSTLDSTIYTTLDIMVVRGLSGFNLYKNAIGDANIVSTEQQLVIDKINKYNVNITNTANINGVNAVYKANGNIGYIIEADEDNIGTLGVNTVGTGNLEAGNSYIYSSLGTMNLIGFTSGDVSLKMTPVLFTGNQEFGETIYSDGSRILTSAEVETAIANGTLDNYQKFEGVVKITNLAKNYNFEIVEQAKSLTLVNGNNSKVILPTGRAEFDIAVVSSAYTKTGESSYTLNEKLNVIIYKDGVEAGMLNISDGETSVEYEENKFKNSYNNSLIEFEVVSVTYTPVEGENQLRIVYTVRLTFNQEKYLSNTDTYSMNDQEYLLRFYPGTNTTLKELDSSKYSFTIKPQRITDIYTAFYPSSQTTMTDEFNPLESATDYIAPGRYGLLVINVYPKFNDADYYEVTVPYEYRQSITLTQMYAVYDNSSESSLLTGYQNAIPAAAQLSDYMGIRLYNISNNSRRFDGNLYVRVLVTSNVPEGTQIDLTVNAYKEGSNDPVADPAICSLSVSPLPGITATVNGKTNNIIVAKTFSKVGIINAVEFSGEIEYEIVPTKGSASDYKIEFTEEGFVFTALSTAYGGADVSVRFSVHQVINGIREESFCIIYFKIVEFELLSVSVQDAAVNDAGENQLDILNGVTKMLNVNIQAHIDTTNISLMNHKTNIEKQFAGQGVVASGVSAPNNWFRRNNYGADPYSDISLSVNPGESLIFNQYEFVSKNNAYYIKATRISDVTILVLKVTYYYDGNGIPRVYYTGLSTPYSLYELDFVFRLNIKDNSTYDHPNPVYSYEDIAEMKAGRHYILMNNLTFRDFVPFKVDFASFDGNGYVITIENFDLSQYKSSQTQVNIGLFETISSDAILKNLVLDVSDLLISEYDMSLLLNSTDSEVIARYNKINASDITNVNFGLIAGTNSGTITNVKIINTSNTNNNYLYVYTTQNKIGTVTPSARIGGIAATNSGIITNSFVGVNASTVSGSRVFTGVVSGNYGTSYSYPFRIAGSNNIAGVAYSNSGKVISTYVNAVGITNTSFLGDGTLTAGLVADNGEGAVISNAFVQGNNINKFRASEEYKIESKGNMGGLVCSNSGQIKDAYSNIAISTNSGRSGGFVFQNNATGTIKNAYSTAKNSVGSRAHGAFLGTNEIGEVNNSASDSSLTSIYYLVLENEFINDNEVATPIKSTGEAGGAVIGASQADPFLYAGSFNGFSFSLGSNMNSVWTYTDTNLGPQLINCVANDTYSNRTLSSTIENEAVDGGEVTYTYNYDYVDNVGDQNTAYGEKNNPLIVRDGREFVNFIINNSNAQGVFGGENTTVSHVRLINDITFTSNEEEDTINLNEYKVDNKLLSDVTFNGTLDGNNLTISGIRLLDNSKGAPKSTYGLFKQVGHDSNSEAYNAVIKNVTFEVDQLIATNVKMVGTVAGKSVNATYINTHVMGGAAVQGRNIVGGVTGVIAGNSSMIEVTSTLTVSAVFRSQVDTANVLPYFDYGYAQYSGDYDSTLSYDNSECEYSYAGGIAGIIDVNNSDILDKSNSLYNGQNYLEIVFNVDSEDGGTYARTTTKYRTDEPTSPIVKDLKVSGEITITGEYAGGLFGYVGNTTHVYNSMFELNTSNTQEINGLYMSGGIVAENHGILEKVRVEYDETNQADMDIKISTTGEVVGNKYLFKQSAIMIGGIVGQNEDAIIIDSYSKANVYNTGAYVAGGIVGKVQGYSMLQHVYTTGLVYGRYVMGGVLGYVNSSKYAYYDNDRIYATPVLDANNVVIGYTRPVNGAGDIIPLVNTEKVILDYVVALNTWNAETDNVVKENFASVYSYTENAATLYYDYSYVMPEIGNQYVNKMYNVVEKTTVVDGTEVTTFEDKFASLGNKENEENRYTYAYTKNIGSLVGRVTSYGESVGSENISYETGCKALTSDIFKASVLDIFNTSTTTARVSGSEDLLLRDGNHSDEYSVKNLEQDDVTVYSVTYGANRVANEDITMAGPYSAQYNTFNYVNYLGWQRPRSIVLGDEIEVEQGETKNLMDGNAFMDWISIGVGADSEKVFKISEDTSLPEFIVGIYSNMITISNADEWKENFGVDKTTKNKYYAISRDITLDYGNQNFGKFEGTMIGIGDSKPKINIVASAGLIPLFNDIASANISNVDFIITFTSNSNTLYAQSNSENVGALANYVSNTVFTNCSITIDYGAISRNLITQNNTNMGGVFGKILNSTFRFAEEDKIHIANYGTNRITVQQSKDFNFGLFAGYIQSCDISTLPIDIPAHTAVRVGQGQLAIKNIVVGGLIGVTVGTNYPEIKMIRPTSAIDVYLYSNYMNVSMDNAYVGGLIGKLEAGSVGKVAHVGSIYMGPSEVSIQSNAYQASTGSDLDRKIYVSNMYVGGVVGLASSSSKLNNVSNGVRFDTANVESKITQSSSSKIYVNGYSGTGKGTSSIMVGGLVGRLDSSKILGILNDESKSESANNADIIVKNDYASGANYVGGIAGFVSGRTVVSEIDKVTNTGDITFHGLGTSNYVGGIVGRAEVVILSTSQNLGRILQKSVNHITGGIIGAVGNYSESTGYISECIAYGDITVESKCSDKAVIGGIVGRGVYENDNYKIRVSKCISMVRPIGTNDNTSNVQGIAANVDQSDAKNYYIAEFATGSTVGTGLTYGEFGLYISNNMCGDSDPYSMIKVSNVDTITPRLNLLYSLMDFAEAELSEGTKYNPRLVKVDNNNKATNIVVGQDYYYVINGLSLVKIDNQISSNFKGLFASTKETVIEYSKNIPFVGTNNGILSGIMLNVTNSANTSYLTNVNDLSGVIFNCGVVGVVSNGNLVAPIAQTNNGRIIQTGVALVNTTNATIGNVSGFVDENSGVIYQSYSTYQMPNATASNTYYGLVRQNVGNLASLTNSYFGGFYNGQMLASTISGSGVYYDNHVVKNGTNLSGSDVQIGSTWSIQEANTYSVVNFGYPVLNSTKFKNALELRTTYKATVDSYSYDISGNTLLITHNGMFANMESIATHVTKFNYQYYVVSNIKISATYTNAITNNAFRGVIKGFGTDITVTVDAPLFETMNGGSISDLVFTNTKSISSIVASKSISDTNIDELTFNNAKTSNALITPTYNIVNSSSGMKLTNIKLKNNISIGGGAETIGAIVSQVSGLDNASNSVTIEYINYDSPIAVQGTISGGTAGGLFGSVSYANIDSVNSYSTVSGTTSAGGIVGVLSNSTLTNATNIGSVSVSTGSATTGAGGIVGTSNDSITLSYCYNGTASNTEGTISGKNNVGGIVGRAAKVSLSNAANYFDISGDNYVAGIIGNAQSDATIVTVSTEASASIVSNKTDPLYVAGILGYGEVRSSYPSLSGDIYMDSNITVSLSQRLKAIDFNNVYGREFEFKMTDIVDAGNGYCSFIVSGSRELVKGLSQPKELRDTYKVNHIVGNKESVASASGVGTIYVNKTFAKYSIRTTGGVANTGLFVDYKGVKWDVSITGTAYSQYSYGINNGVSYGDPVKSGTSETVTVNTGKENLRDSVDTAAEWTSRFRNQGFSFPAGLV